MPCTSGSHHGKGVNYMAVYLDHAAAESGRIHLYYRLKSFISHSPLLSSSRFSRTGFTPPTWFISSHPFLHPLFLPSHPPSSSSHQQSDADLSDQHSQPPSSLARRHLTCSHLLLALPTFPSPLPCTCMLSQCGVLSAGIGGAAKRQDGVCMWKHWGMRAMSSWNGVQNENSKCECMGMWSDLHGGHISTKCELLPPNTICIP